MILTEQAYGKLNLALDVLAKRPDGYHDMRMIMQSVDLCDTVTLELDTHKPWQLDCYREVDGQRHRESYPQDERNLAWKAAEAFCKALGHRPDGLTMTVEKRIPVQAGMAGGSADAAAVLRGLNCAYGEPFSLTELCRIGEQVGSDVPYCVLNGTALAEGRGEILTSLRPIPEVWFVLCKPDFAVSTPELFRAIDGETITARPDIDGMLQAIEYGDAAGIGARMENVFQPVANAKYPVVDQICQILRQHNALGAQMTGTGSVVFGMFADRENAQQAMTAVQTHVKEVFLVKPV